MGTRFIATHESMADQRYKDMLVASSADDIVLTRAFTGLQTNTLRPSIVAAGLDPDSLPERGAIEISKDIDIGARESRTRPLARHLERRPLDVCVLKVSSVADLINQTLARIPGGVSRGDLVIPLVRITCDFQSSASRKHRPFADGSGNAPYRP